MRITNDHRDYVAWRVQNGHPNSSQHRFQLLDVALLPDAQFRMSLEVPYCRCRTRSEMGAKRSCEDKAVSETADDVDHERRACDIAAHHAKGLGKRPLDQGHTMRHTVALC